MLQLYDVNKNRLFGLTEYKDLKNERTLDGDEVLSFSFAQNNSKHDSIKEECYIRTDVNEYVVKEVSVKDDWTDFVAKINVEELKGSPFTHFETVEQSCINSVNLVLTGSNWTTGSCDVTKLRTVRKSNCSAWDILQEIRKVYNCDFKFDAINKKVYIYQSRGTDKGAYFSEELNLTSLEVQGDSYDFCTRIIPFGKDGLDIISVNSGVNYVENYQYSNKIITLIWEDNRYINVQSLKDDAILKLNDLSKPVKSFMANIIDLAKVSDKYTEILDYDLGDTITLLSKDKKVKEKQRIVKIVEYPEEPEKNSCEIANRILTFEDMQAETQDAVDTVNSVTTSDGQVDGSKIDGLDYAKIKNVSIKTADIQDASITTAKIGDLQVTTAKIAMAAINTAHIALAAIDTANIKNGAITNALIGVAAVNTTQIADGSITDAKIVELTANKITAGTLSIERLEIRGSTNSIVYELNNITGALQSQNVDTLNGEIVTPRTITADKIVANAITAAEIAARTITANKIVANTITAAEIAAATITAAQIAANTITAAQIAAGAITVDKIASNVGSSLDVSSNESVKIAVGQIGGNNLIRNSRGTYGTYNWGWTIAQYAGDSILEKYCGAGTALRVETTGTSEVYAFQYNIKLKVSTKYTMSGFYYVGANSKGMDLYVIGQKQGNPYNNFDYIRQAKNDGDYSNGVWKYFTYDFTTNSDEISCMIRLDNNGSVTSGTSASTYFCLLQLEEGGNATAWKECSQDAIDYTNSEVDILSDQIALKVNSADFASLIEQNPDHVKIAVGQIGGRNLFKNGGFRKGTTGWALHYWRGSTTYEANTWYNNSSWTLKDGDCDNVSGYFGSTAYVRAVESVEGAVLGHGLRQFIRVQPSTTYTISGLLGLHRCNVNIEVWSTDVNLSPMANIHTTNVSNGAGMGGSTESGWYHYKYTFTTPSDCYGICFYPFMSQHIGGGTDSYLFYDRFQFEEGENQTAWKPSADEVKTTDVTVDETGLTVNNGSVTIKNPSGTVVIDGEHNMHKIMVSGTTTLSGTNHNITNTVEITHNLGYVPTFAGFQKQYGETHATQTPAFTVASGTGSLGFLTMLRLRADSTKLYIDYIRENNKSNEASYNATVTYYIYKEVAF